jgi:hypothetical protein
VLVDIADWFELSRAHRQGCIQVDEAPGLRARTYGEYLRIARSRSMLPDPLFLTVLIITMLPCYRLKARRHAPGLTPTVCLKTRVR